jgi:hypothetical protein
MTEDLEKETVRDRITVVAVMVIFGICFAILTVWDGFQYLFPRSDIVCLLTLIGMIIFACLAIS